LSTTKDKLQELLDTRAQADQALEKLKTPITILFSDIKGSTAFAEKKGDVEYLTMIGRHNALLFPIIEAHGGSVVKTLGDAILAKFEDSVGAIKAAAGMQRVLVKDREGREEIDQIRIRIGLHHGLGILKDNDVFGDVVNAASRVQHQAETDEILITGALLDATKAAGFECAKIGRAELKGKDEPIDLFAVAWSESAAKQLIDEVQARYERRFRELKKRQEDLEEEFDLARDQWRNERRTLNAEIEKLEESAERARQMARQQLSEDLQSELRFQLETAIQARQQAEQELASAQQNFEVERRSLKAQIAGMQASVLDAMERSNNPARMAMALRDQLEVRLAEAKQDWQLQWEGERKRFNAEIERLKRAAGGAADGKKEAARRALLEKLGKVPAAKTAVQWERDFQDAQIQWGTERDQLLLKTKRLENEVQRDQDGVRADIFQEMRAQYEPRITEGDRDRQRLEQEIQSVSGELAGERQRLNARIEQLQKAVPDAQEAARKQTLAEMQTQCDAKVEEANKLRLRSERKFQDVIEELEASQRRAKKQITTLEEQLREAKEIAYKARTRATS
jgi:class 3 adenylate cyclase